MQRYTIDELIQMVRDHQIHICTGSMTGMDDADIDAHYDGMMEAEDEIKRRVEEGDSE